MNSSVGPTPGNSNFANNNRISKQNLKDYGMSIITGGKTPQLTQGIGASATVTGPIKSSLAMQDTTKLPL